MMLFLDWLRANDAERGPYARVKRDLSAQKWAYMQQYPDAKTEIIAQNMVRGNASTKATSPGRSPGPPTA